MNKLKIKMVLLLASTFMLGMIVVPQVAHAQQNRDNNDIFGTAEIEDESDGIALGKRSLQATAVRLINVALSLLGIIAVVIVLIGGFKWMTAGGNDDKIAEARKLIFAGIVGMAIILSAWAIARFVLANLLSATDTNGSKDRLLDGDQVEDQAPANDG